MNNNFIGDLDIVSLYQFEPFINNIQEFIDMVYTDGINPVDYDKYIPKPTEDDEYLYRIGVI